MTNLLAIAPEACAKYHNDTAHDVKTTRIACDEIWSFVSAKDKNLDAAKAVPDGAGDVWTWAAIDADRKIILSYDVGARSGDTTCGAMVDLA